MSVPKYKRTSSHRPSIVAHSRYSGTLGATWPSHESRTCASESRRGNVRAGKLTFGEAPAPLEEHSFLLVPASESGKRFAEEAQRLLPEGVQLVNVPGQADLMFCRDQNGLSAEELGHLLRNCRKAYEESAAVPNSSPHARFDIQDWTPLDP